MAIMMTSSNIKLKSSTLHGMDSLFAFQMIERPWNLDGSSLVTALTAAPRHLFPAVCNEGRTYFVPSLHFSRSGSQQPRIGVVPLSPPRWI